MRSIACHLVLCPFRRRSLWRNLTLLWLLTLIVLWVRIVAVQTTRDTSSGVTLTLAIVVAGLGVLFATMLHRLSLHS